MSLQRKLRALAPGLVFLATLAAIAWLLRSGLALEWLSEDWSARIDRDVRGKGAAGELLFLAVGGLACALAVPRHFVSFLGGYAFGFGPGTLLALAATEIGCALTFFYARLVGRPLVSKRFGARVRRIDDFLAANPFAMTLLIRLLPVGNNFATSLAAGVSRVPAWLFLLGSLVGYLPQTLVFALAGSGVEAGAGLRVGLAALLFLVSAAIGIWLYRRYRHGRTLGEEVDEALDEQSPA
ncbi:MAG: TVP38/TMEM64 family protein [Betaproteobacteria bacterium]|nr:TVP38/TMEM64 family protein [Betaproteobacteria bacterium]